MNIKTPLLTHGLTLKMNHLQLEKLIYINLFQ